ncbi:MAG: ureidoacrylate peracid hydrolase [Chloroflexota bacterium]|jgi:nicotinamidase-related amidase|nr:ureidoacrylate peracid hydrolase [Chloroflexota bacterium]
MRTTLEEMVEPAKTALLVLDVQNDFCQDEPRRQMIPRVASVLEAARHAGVTVVYVQNTVLPGGLSDSSADLARRARIGLRTSATLDGTDGHRFVPEVAPLDGDLVVRKHRASAFNGTTLDTILRSAGIETVVLVGTATQGSVINTAYGGIGLNYYVVVVRDAVSSWRDDLHQAAMLLMENAVNEMTDVATLATAWTEAPAAAA